MKLFDFGFVIPLLDEAKPLLKDVLGRKIHTLSSQKIYTGILFKKNVSVIITGCGKIKTACATQLLIDTFPAKKYLHFGTAGALSNKLKIGDLILATEVIEHDVIELFPKKMPPPGFKIAPLLKKDEVIGNNLTIVWGKILSGDEDIVTEKRKVQLYTLYKGLSVDWESAGFALTCKLNNVSGHVIRGISDLAHEHTTKEYEKNQLLVLTNIVHLIEKYFAL